mmetsp:Transcript_2388/g.4803  ORF Transcript_2388/g.4803 Transcript_2388/m.4803 type:complete len:325 (-) Transcript_2388:765-1739(-)
MFGIPSVSSSSAFLRGVPSSRRDSIPACTPAQMLVQSSACMFSSAQTASSFPSASINVWGNATKALSLNPMRDSRSTSPSVWITVFTACFTMSRMLSPSSTTLPCSSSRVALFAIDPDVSMTHAMSTGSRALTSGTAIRTHTFTLDAPFAGTSFSGDTNRVIFSSSSPASADASNAGHSSHSSSIRSCIGMLPKSIKSSTSMWNATSVVLALDTAPVAEGGESSGPATRKTFCREAMRTRQMGQQPLLSLTLHRHSSQPHWWPHGVTRKFAGRSQHTTHVPGPFSESPPPSLAPAAAIAAAAAAAPALASASARMTALDTSSGS